MREVRGISAASPCKPALLLDNVSKQYGSPEDPIRALEGISLEVKEGEFLSIIGPSGCGKSTLFRIIGGLVPEWQGRIEVNGVPSTAGNPAIGMVFQEESTFPWLTVIENAEFALKAHGVPKAQRRERAFRLLKLVGLDDFAHRYPSELSGGMRQRTSIARTLVSEPRILLMDEPFAAVDEQTRLLLGDRVLRIHQELKQTTVLITHNLTEAVQLSDRVVVMTFRPGRIKTIVDIDLPRPRRSDIVSSDAFLRLVGSIWNDLREEASKGLEDAEKENKPVKVREDSMLKKCGAVLVVLGLFSAHSASADTLRLAVSQKGFWDTSIPDFGQRKGFFKEEGLELDLLYTNGTAETQQAVLSGSVDVGVAVGLLGIFAAYSKNAPVRVIAAEWAGASDFFWYVRSDSTVKALSDAHGKTVGFSTIGSSSNLVLLSLLEQTKTKARPVATGGASATMTQVMSGQIDVGWSVAPIGLQEAEQGKIRLVARGSDAKGLEHQTTRVTITNAAILQTKRDAIARFKRAYARALDWAYTDPQAIAWFAQGLGVPLELAKSAVENYYPKLAMNPSTVRGLALSMQQGIEFKRLSAPLTAEQIKELFPLVEVHAN